MAVCFVSNNHISLISEVRDVLHIDKIRRLTERVKNVLENVEIDHNTELMCGASLAHHGLLGSVLKMDLCDVDLSPVPAQHLASLVSCVNYEFCIQNVSGCDLTSILTIIKCPELVISWQRLEREETEALVQAMESSVEKVLLWSEVTLDIEALAEYSGQGVCKSLELRDDTAPRYSEEMRTWARNRNWKVQFFDDDLLLIEYVSVYDKNFGF